MRVWRILSKAIHKVIHRICGCPLTCCKASMHAALPGPCPASHSPSGLQRGPTAKPCATRPCTLLAMHTGLVVQAVPRLFPVFARECPFLAQRHTFPCRTSTCVIHHRITHTVVHILCGRCCPQALHAAARDGCSRRAATAHFWRNGMHSLAEQALVSSITGSPTQLSTLCVGAQHLPCAGPHSKWVCRRKR